MIVGIVLAICTLFACSMFITKRFKNRKFQQYNHCVHKMMGSVLLILVIFHLIQTWPLHLQRPAIMYFLGIFMVLCIMALMISFYMRNKIGKRWIFIHKIAAILMVLCLVGHVYFGISSLLSYNLQVSSIAIEEIDLNLVSDGEYIGEKNVGYIYGKVKVQIKNHKITSIEILEHRTERGKKAEVIVDTIVAEQRNKVDVISGATNSSKVIMEAVEHALHKGIK